MDLVDTTKIEYPFVTGHLRDSFKLCIRNSNVSEVRTFDLVDGPCYFLHED